MSWPWLGLRVGTGRVLARVSGAGTVPQSGGKTRAACPGAVPGARNSDRDNHSAAGQEVAGHRRAPVPSTPLPCHQLHSPQADLSLSHQPWAGPQLALASPHCLCQEQDRRHPGCGWQAGGSHRRPLGAGEGAGGFYCAPSPVQAVPWLFWGVGSGCLGVSRCFWGWESAPPLGAERGLLGCCGGLAVGCRRTEPGDW